MIRAHGVVGLRSPLITYERVRYMNPLPKLDRGFVLYIDYFANDNLINCVLGIAEFPPEFALFLVFFILRFLVLALEWC